MATLDETVGGASSNTYATEAEADAYFSDHIRGTTWLAYTSDQKTDALLQARRLLDFMPEAWTGSQASESQALRWPRDGMLSRDSVAILDTVIPDELKWAQIELAALLVASDLTEDSDAFKENIKSLKAGSLQVVYRDEALTQREVLERKLPDRVRMLLVPSWLRDLDEEENQAQNGLILEVL